MQSLKIGHLSTRGAIVKRASISLQNVTKLLSPGGKRVVTGWASTVRPDRVGDIVVPSGGTWSLPLPLLVQHDHNNPVGWVRTVELRNNGLWVSVEFAEGIESADRAWNLVSAELIDAFSIGFRATKTPEILADGGRRFTHWELLECSVVVVPCNADARISRNRTATATAPIKLISATQVLQTRHPGSVKLLTDAKPHAGVPLVSPRKAGDGAVKLRIKGDGSIPLGRPK